jgi:hypothetical protein
MGKRRSLQKHFWSLLTWTSKMSPWHSLHNIFKKASLKLSFQEYEILNYKSKTSLCLTHTHTHTQASMHMLTVQNCIIIRNYTIVHTIQPCKEISYIPYILLSHLPIKQITGTEWWKD